MNYRFGVFDFDTETSELRKNGRPTALEPQPARVLAVLLARADAIVTRDELKDAIWGRDTYVDFDRGLAYCLSHIRTALGDSGQNPRFVQTVPRKGYKFIAPVKPVQRAESVPPVVTLESPPPKSNSRSPRRLAVVSSIVAVALVLAGSAAWIAFNGTPRFGKRTIAVSIFDNETGMPEHDRRVANMSDAIVARLTGLAPDKLAIVGNAAILRQPRNIRNLKAVAQGVQAEYVVLGQLQRNEPGFRFITHLIRLRDESHLRANRLTFADGDLSALEAAVEAEFERAIREHVLR